MDKPMLDKIKIAVIVPHRPFFGNILTQLPLFQGLRELYPNAHICVWSKTSNSQLIVDNHLADELIVYKKWSLFSLFSAFKKEKYQQVYNIYSGSEKMHLLGYLAQVPERYGLSDSSFIAKLYHKHQLIKSNDGYIALKNINLINYVHNTQFKPSNIEALAPQTIESQKLITFLPGGGAGDFKRWPIEDYCQTFKAINKHHQLKAMFVLGPQEQHYTTIIEQELAGYNIEIAQSPDLKTLISIAQQSQLTIANDCGPMHIFQMLAVPLITIWGWQENNPPFKVLSEWYYSTENALAILPPEENKSINAISVERVASSALMQLNRLHNS